MEKTRLDVFLTEHALCESREKAKAFIMAGQVYVNGMKASKAGDTVKDGDNVEVRAKSEFVSRGGFKLKKAVASFDIDLSGKVCMDIGASTGGFTDCMLKNGAAKVFCVDVGYGQLAWSLRTDERVVNLERTNIRYLTPEVLGVVPDFASIDVSFISLKLVLPAVKVLIAPGGRVVALIKPQFEAGREKVGKKGVVREKSTHEEVIRSVTEFAVSNGFSVLGLDYSPIKGPEGNIEYLAYLQSDDEGRMCDTDIAELVEDSHEHAGELS